MMKIKGNCIRLREEGIFDSSPINAFNTTYT
jgi:hypothetical protein